MSTFNGPFHARYTSSPEGSRPQESLRALEMDSQRALIGIPPAQYDEHDRGLVFFYDSWTGQPSQASASDGSEYTNPEESIQASPSDHSTRLAPAIRPPSNLDIPRIEHSPRRLNESGPASLGTNNAQSSPVLLQTPSGSWTSDGQTPPPSSPSPDPTSTDGFNPLEGISNPQDTIIIDQQDLEYLHLQILLEQTNIEKKALHNPSFHASEPPTRSKKHPKRQIARKERRNLTEEGKKRARELRRIGVCLRCLFNHEPCGLGDVCPRCKALTTPRIWMLSCVRVRLGDAKLHRTGALSFPEGLPAIEVWPSLVYVPVSLYNIGTADKSCAPESRPRLQIVCREHTPIPGVRSSKSWTKGAYKIDIHLPTYAMTPYQLRKAAKNMDELIDRNYAQLVSELGVGQDEIVARTLSEAIRQAEKWPVLKSALKISVMSQLASKSFNIYGTNTLGIQQEQDPDCPYYKRIPIPPLLDAQIDSLWMDKMASLRKKVLTELRGMIAQRGRKHWLTIFLTILVLLFNLEFIYQNQRQQSQHYQETTFRQRSMLESWEYAAKNLMAHFHTICHGTIPLNVNWNEEVRNAAEVDEESLTFLTGLKCLVQSRVDELSVLAKGEPGQPLVWISALFLPHEKE